MSVTIEIQVPGKLDPREARALAESALRKRAQLDDFVQSVELKPDLVHPAVAWHVVAADHRWRELMHKYGVFTSTEIALLRGANPKNRSVATNLAKREKLLSFIRGGRKLYPRFQFKGSSAHPSWKSIVTPLLDAGWQDEDILLWMTSPNGSLEGKIPADLLNASDVDRVIADAEDEAKGIW
ncbi:hypothetical protein [Nesterenkonia alkaliphila]|uniref:DUF2384 domain-containing protein n=1 Tax=Nesterenkonia alkaliphila TaxID=1463631 RepID=A0A7K1UEM7_9MICC|nr:hypothetical protein [Nesterenkonia alkaliphila]MVT24935.1 hypothetical protein [Nesterenkonia alkaliphila]GFZ86809.1 hypothetical protein GCM10011359_14850 [Nesterenkonia alkaliphila]